jgi:hypothetical protein
MAKALSKSQLASELAAMSGLTKKAGAEMLDHLASLAYKHAKSQGPPRAQSRHGRSHPDPGQEGRQIPGGQGRQGRHPRCKVIILAVKWHSDFLRVPFFLDGL